jgi:N-methylhydantoinase A
MADDLQAAVDIGGTFTDILLVDPVSERHVIGKILTTPADPAVGVRKGLSAALEDSDRLAAELRTVVHATTLVTNAVLERKGARAALIVTEGFRDLVVIGREHRYDMYDVLLQKPEPLVDLWDVFCAPERVLVDGTVLVDLDEDAIAAIGSEIHARGIESVAVCLLHSYLHPAHEIRVRDILLECWEGFHVTLSHEVVGELREYERATTTTANAYVLAGIDQYLGRLEADLSELGHSGGLLVMLSSGGVATTETARRFPVRLIESGPAAGALAAAEAGRRMGRDDLLSFDMGGTTAKACIISGGRPRVANALEVGRLARFRKGSGLPLSIASVELIEIGAGGGSHARIDSFGLVQVGPDSAGSEPGPMCYGLGGEIPTVTDADLVLGYLNPGFFLGGRMNLDAQAATRGISGLAERMQLEPARAAWTVHEVVNENMANAARVHAVEVGTDLHNLPLFAFGGAGPVHAYRVALNLGIPLLIAPLGAGVGSTIGLLAAPLVFDFVRSAVMPMSRLDWQTINQMVADMAARGVDLLSDAGVAADDVRVEYAVDMRMIGQAHEITVPLGDSPPRTGEETRLRDAFDLAYTRLFGRQPPNVAAEVVSWRVSVAGPRPTFPIHAVGAMSDGAKATGAVKGRRPAFFPERDGYVETPVYDRYLLRPGMSLVGPAIIEERESTLVVGPGGVAKVDEFLNVLVEMPS